MIFCQKWDGVRINNGEEREKFPATVPGNIQDDFARYLGIDDVMYGNCCTKLEEYECDTWEYRTRLEYTAKSGETVWFVSGGIDYKYDIFLGGELIYSYEGMFKPVELDITEAVKSSRDLTIRIYPHPKREGAFVGTRDEADASCKPAVSYGWDWNPRLLISGMWQDAYVETRDSFYIGKVEPRYKLSDDFKTAIVSFDIDCASDTTVSFVDKEGALLYKGDGRDFVIENPRLWWCNGQGDAYLYTWIVENGGCRREGRLGFRRVRMLRNIDADDPIGMPKSCYDAPITLELNGRRIFMKGSNFVNPDIFWGRINRQRYESLVNDAFLANMNILRLWGGASFCKRDFYELCDEYGIMVWQEFMLACNSYPNTDEYLSVLESEAASMIEALRHHACVVIWCGGNELFNGWSGMHDQSLPLRMLGSLCYTLDRDKPFLMTSPLTGMGHGGYMFYEESTDEDVLESFPKKRYTAYTEFGVPSISNMDVLKMIIPKQELNEITPTQSWLLHHAIDAWRPQSHACLEILSMYFGQSATLEERIEQSNLLQSEGLKSIFEEARRQWPHCSAALNWCFNEPWRTAANCSILSYPDIKKPAYYSVAEALRGGLFSARIPKFSWMSGEKFRADIWLLNDSCEEKIADISVVLKIGESEYNLLDFKGASVGACQNKELFSVCFELPVSDAGDMKLCLRSSDPQLSSEYTVLYKKHLVQDLPKGLNM